MLKGQDFCLLLFLQNSYIETTAQDSANQTIADDSLTDEIIVRSTPLKQDQSVSVA